jgi:hypothetical protein
MTELRKVNWRNVGIVIGISILGMAIGFIDRIVNYVRPIEDFSRLIALFLKMRRT